MKRYSVRIMRTGETRGSSESLERAEARALTLARETLERIAVFDAESTRITFVYADGRAERIDIVKAGREQRARLEYQGARIT